MCVGVESGWEEVEGKAIKMVGITTNFAIPLTMEEEKSLTEKMRMVSNLIVVNRRAVELGMWNMQPANVTQVYQNEITCRASRVVRDMRVIEVTGLLGVHAILVHVEESWKSTSVRNRPRRISTLTRCGRLPLREIQQRSYTSVNKGPRLPSRARWPKNVSPRSRRNTWQDHCRVDVYKQLDLRTKRSKSPAEYFQLIRALPEGFYRSESQQYGVRVQKGWEHSVILVAATG